MNHTQHFHPANLQFLMAEARHDAKEFAPRPAPAQLGPQFTPADSAGYRFLLRDDQATASLALALRLIGKRPGEILGFAQVASGRQVAVIRRQSFARRQLGWMEV